MIRAYLTGNLTVAIEWKPLKHRTDVLKHNQILFQDSMLLFVIRNTSAYPESLALPGNSHLGMNPFDQNGSVPYSCLYFFFRNSFSIFIAPRVFNASSY